MQFLVFSDSFSTKTHEELGYVAQHHDQCQSDKSKKCMLNDKHIIQETQRETFLELYIECKCRKNAPKNITKVPLSLQFCGIDLDFPSLARA